MDMNLITLTFEVPPEKQTEYVKILEAFREQRSKQGFVVSLFREKGDHNRFFQMLLSEKSIDEMTDLLMKDTAMKRLFQEIKDGGGRVLVSVLEQVI